MRQVVYRSGVPVLTSKKIFFILLIIILTHPLCTFSIWLDERYWSTIRDDGLIEDESLLSDFLTFAPLNGFIAFWTPNTFPSEPAFGHAYLVSTFKDPTMHRYYQTQRRICAVFINSTKNNTGEICGGFRVLTSPTRFYRKHPGSPYEHLQGQEKINPFRFTKSAIANPDRSIEYLNKQIVRIFDDIHGRWHFGWGYLKDREAFASMSGKKLLWRSFKSNPHKYVQQVEYLELKQEYFNSPIFISPSITVKSKSTPHVFEITKQQQPKLALSDVEKCLVQLIEDTNRKSKNRYIDDGQLPWKIIEETPAIIHFGIYGNEEQNAVFKYERPRPKSQTMASYSWLHDDNRISGGGIDWSNRKIGK